MSESKAIAIIPRSTDETYELAERLSKATTISAELRGSPANILAAIMAGAELGFAPMAALRSVHIIKGVPKLSADAMAAAVMASGKAQYFEPKGDATNTSATWVTKRVGSEREHSVTWTAEDAKRAGLVSDNHRLYPRQMLSARAKSELARSIYPDILAGVYTDEEIPRDAQAIAHRDPAPANDIVDAEIVEPVTDDLLERVTHAESLATLDALKPRCNALPNGPIRTQVREAYGVRMKHFESVAKASAAIEKTVVVESVA